LDALRALHIDRVHAHLDGLEGLLTCAIGLDRRWSGEQPTIIVVIHRAHMLPLENLGVLHVVMGMVMMVGKAAIVVTAVARGHDFTIHVSLALGGYLQ